MGRRSRAARPVAIRDYRFCAGSRRCRISCAVKINATDQLAGGIEEPAALDLVEMLDGTEIDLIDISGGAYFPGAAAASDGTKAGPYFLEFARLARRRTDKPLMTAGGFKSGWKRRRR